MSKSLTDVMIPRLSDQLRRSPDSEGATRAKAARKALLFIGVVVFGATIGVALAYLPPLLVFGAIAAIASIVVVLMQPYLGLLLYTVIFLVCPAELYPVLAPLHLERIVGTFTLIGLALVQIQHERRLLLDGSRQTYLLLLFLLSVLVSVPFAYWRQLAVEGLIDTLKIVVFYLMVVHLVSTRARLRFFVWTFCSLTAYLAITSLHAYLSGSSKFAQGIERAVGQTSAGGDPNHLGTTLASAFPLFLLLACTKSMGWRRLPLGIGAVVLVATMAITGSRASLLGFFGGLICLWWLSPRRFLTAILGFVLLIVGLQFLPEQYQTRYSTMTGSDLDASSRSRLDAWTAGLHMVLDRPLTGVGIGCFGVAHATNYSPESAQNWLEAHSLYVQVAAELGFVGAVIFFSLLLEMLRVNRRAMRQLKGTQMDWEFERKLLDGLVAGFLVLLASGLFGHSLQRRTWYVFAATGLVVFRLYLDARGPTSAPQSASAAPVALPGGSERRGA